MPAEAGDQLATVTPLHRAQRDVGGRLADADNAFWASIIRGAALTVCDHATDEAEAAHLLDVLGLLATGDPA